ncbi:hypothetical protein [Methylorubrum populi]|nr:hypothetical protein [Methylorubrum populi]
MSWMNCTRPPVTDQPSSLDLPKAFETGGIISTPIIAGCVEHSKSV